VTFEIRQKQQAQCPLPFLFRQAIRGDDRAGEQSASEPQTGKRPEQVLAHHGRILSGAPIHCENSKTDERERQHHPAPKPVGARAARFQPKFPFHDG